MCRDFCPHQHIHAHLSTRKSVLSRLCVQTFHLTVLSGSSLKSYVAAGLASNDGNCFVFNNGVQQFGMSANGCEALSNLRVDISGCASHNSIGLIKIGEITRSFKSFRVAAIHSLIV